MLSGYVIILSRGWGLGGSNIPSYVILTLEFLVNFDLGDLKAFSDLLGSFIRFKFFVVTALILNFLTSFEALVHVSIYGTNHFRRR